MSDDNKNDSYEDLLSETRRKKVENFELNIDKTDKKKNKKYNNKKIKKSKKSVKLFKLVWLSMVISICLMLGQFSVLGAIDMLAIGKNDDTVKIEIPKNSSKNAIVDILYENRIIHQPDFFKLYLFLTKGSKKFIPGTFEVRIGSDYEAIINYLMSNANRVDTDIVDVTIPEGKNVLEIADILEKNNICTKDEFLTDCKSDQYNKEFSFLTENENPKVIYKVEGYLFPDTYSFYKKVEPKYVIKKMLNNFNNKMTKKLLTDETNEKVSVKTLAEKQNMKIKDLISLASIVQAEAFNDSDMPGVTSVIINRLKTNETGGMSQFGDAINGCLSVDATTYYPWRSKDKLPADVGENYESPYNTYKNSGIPIGPICNPGLTSIESVLNNKQSQYYFYCHDKKGKTYYAKTFSEHSANLKKANISK